MKKILLIAGISLFGVMMVYAKSSKSFKVIKKSFAVVDTNLNLLSTTIKDSSVSFYEGERSFYKGESNNPYIYSSVNYDEWENGFKIAKEDWNHLLVASLTNKELASEIENKLNKN